MLACNPLQMKINACFNEVLTPRLLTSPKTYLVALINMSKTKQTPDFLTNLILHFSKTLARKLGQNFDTIIHVFLSHSTSKSTGTQSC